MILVTGATGFVGAALIARLTCEGTAVRGSIRRVSAAIPRDVSTVEVDSLTAYTDWSRALEGVHAVVHTAARVHVMSETSTDPMVEFRRVNVEGTLNLARQAAAAGVQRFVFVSSVKVNGEATTLGQPFSADDLPAPIDPYGVSKMEAEGGLREISAKTGLEVVVIRPPLVYGPGVRANFRALMRAVRNYIPLPLGAVHNLRSLVAIDNLTDFIVTCIQHPAAANHIFLVSDGNDLSTPELIRRMAHTMGKPALLLPIPVSLLEAGAACLDKRDVIRRLCGSLQVDITKNRSLLNWIPPIGVDEGLKWATSV